MSDNETKKCPQCAETIQAAAIKCRFCGSQLAGTAAPPAAHKIPAVNRKVLLAAGVILGLGAVGSFYVSGANTTYAAARAGLAAAYAVHETAVGELEALTKAEERLFIVARAFDKDAAGRAFHEAAEMDPRTRGPRDRAVLLLSKSHEIQWTKTEKIRVVNEGKQTVRLGGGGSELIQTWREVTDDEIGVARGDAKSAEAKLSAAQAEALDAQPFWAEPPSPTFMSPGTADATPPQAHEAPKASTGMLKGTIDFGGEERTANMQACALDRTAEAQAARAGRAAPPVREPVEFCAPVTGKSYEIAVPQGSYDVLLRPQGCRNSEDPGSSEIVDVTVGAVQISNIYCP